MKDSKIKTIEATENDFFHDILKRNHIICFSETWRDKTDDKDFSFDNNFSEYHELGFRNHRVGRASGGMSLLVRKSIISHVSIMKADSYHFWCKLDRKFFNWESDLYICFLYIPPSTSTVLKSGMSLNFETLQTECASFEEKGWVLLFGDTNARTKYVNDFIENDELKHQGLPKTIACQSQPN